MSELNTTPAPTPETDKATVTTDWMTGKPVVPADFARRLERERDEARDELLLCYGAERDYQRDQLRARVTTLEQRILDDNKAFGCELRDPNGTIWEHADKLQKENADLRQSLENHAQANDKLVVEVADLRRDRERLMKNYLISPVVCGTVLGSLYGAFINTTSPAVHPNVRETLKYAHGLLSAAIDQARAGKTEGGV